MELGLVISTLLSWSVVVREAFRFRCMVRSYCAGDGDGDGGGGWRCGSGGGECGRLGGSLPLSKTLSHSVFCCSTMEGRNARSNEEDPNFKSRFLFIYLIMRPGSKTMSFWTCLTRKCTREWNPGVYVAALKEKKTHTPIHILQFSIYLHLLYIFFIFPYIFSTLIFAQ